MPEKDRNKVDVSALEQEVQKIADLDKIDGILICTEPKAHKPYIFWAIEHEWNIFSDKPLTAFDDPNDMDVLYKDYLEIQSAVSRKNLSFVLCCERRGHMGYQYLLSEIAKIIDEYKVPITYVNIHYGDGLWNMPDEFFSRENHPYKYGYGSFTTFRLYP